MKDQEQIDKYQKNTGKKPRETKIEKMTKKEDHETVLGWRC